MMEEQGINPIGRLWTEEYSHGQSVCPSLWMELWERHMSRRGQWLSLVSECPVVPRSLWALVCLY